MSVVSLRLGAILDLVRPSNALADVGTDHGLVPVHAVLRGLAEHAYGCDLREEPLRVARRNVARHQLGARVSLLQGDGLAPLVSLGVDTVVMAGLSGQLMERVCLNAPQVLQDVKQLIVQPNTQAHVMRAWARGAGFHLTRETMVDDKGRCFVACAFERKPGPDPAYLASPFGAESLFQLGPLLLRERDVLARRHYRNQCRRLRGFVEAGVSSYRAELAVFEEACALF